MKRPNVFSIFHDQSVFMTAVMGIMTFLAVMALGISIGIGTAVVRWNRQWDVFATIQVSDKTNTAKVEKILGDNNGKIENLRRVSNEEMTDLMRPWMNGSNRVLEKYLPDMFEVKFKNKSDMDGVGELVRPHARFITHNDALRPSISAGWKMVTILAIMLVMIIGTIGMCVSFIARNTALLHKRELEILNQVGASDSFVARQMQRIVTRICIVACGGGFLVALPILGIILSVARSARVGVMAMMAVTSLGWGVLCLMPVAIVIFAIIVTKKTTLKILSQDK